MKLPLLIAAVIVGIVFAASLALSDNAFGQTICADRAQVTADLLKQYKESPRGLGITNSGAVLELLRTPSGSTFTIIVTTPNGLTCLVAAGEGWEALPLPVKGEGS